jgi:hypothetical protein
MFFLKIGVELELGNLFVFCSQVKDIKKQLKTQNTLQNTKAVFTFISRHDTFSNQK